MVNKAPFWWHFGLAVEAKADPSHKAVCALEHIIWSPFYQLSHTWEQKRNGFLPHRDIIRQEVWIDSKNKAPLLSLARNVEHGKVDSKNNHYVHSHWRSWLGRQIQVRLQFALRKSSCSLPSSSQDNAPLIMSKSGKSKPDPSSKSCCSLKISKKGAEIGFLKGKKKSLKSVKGWRWKDVLRAWILSVSCPAQDCLLSALTSMCHDQELGLPQPVDRGFLLPARKALLTASLCSPTHCFRSKWVPQSRRTEDFVSANQGDRNCRNQQICHFLTELSLCFKNSWQRLCSQNLQVGVGVRRT